LYEVERSDGFAFKDLEALLGDRTSRARRLDPEVSGAYFAAFGGGLFLFWNSQLLIDKVRAGLNFAWI